MRTNRNAIGLAALLGLALAFAAPAMAGGAKWTGIYAGGAIGYASATTETSLDLLGFNDLITLDGFGAEGVSFTGLAGGDIQTGDFVLGVWGSFTGDDLETKASIDLPGFGSELFSTEIENRWAFGGRIGYLLNEKTLVYATAGYTQAQMSDLRIPLLGLLGGPTSFAIDDLKGYLVGGGIEVELHDGLFLHVQGTYSAFDKEAIEIAPGIASVDIEPHIIEARAGVTYKFNFWDR